MTKNIKEILSEEIKNINNTIRSEFSSIKKNIFPILFEAMEYSLFPGGKRIRPILVKWVAELGSPDISKLNKAMTALEFIHTYSLIHDDLPCMDNDDTRRGKPSNHKKFNEGIAVLAGDALLTEAFFLIGKTGIPELTTVLAENSGAQGMVGGQVADIKKIDDIDYVNDLKTACLFKAASIMGGIIGGITPEHLDKLSDYGINLGRAFQIIDDILDLESGEIDKASMKAFNYIESAKNSISSFKNNHKLLEIADFILKRNH